MTSGRSAGAVTTIYLRWVEAQLHGGWALHSTMPLPVIFPASSTLHAVTSINPLSIRPESPSGDSSLRADQFPGPVACNWARRNKDSGRYCGFHLEPCCLCPCAKMHVSSRFETWALSRPIIVGAGLVPEARAEGCGVCNTHRAAVLEVTDEIQRRLVDVFPYES